MTGGNSEYTNRLAEEKSPYLLQHAHNPVDWYPWGPEAFQTAQREDKPILLSIGYSTCHWCHVMERESFEDPKAAQVLNDAFVNVKVDREERPDIDSVYMTVCQMMTGSGGWPLTILMTPERKPFFAATYLPKESKWGRTGLIDLAERVRGLWRTDRERLLTSAEEVRQALEQSIAHAGGEGVDAGTLEQAYKSFEQRFDNRHGGFGNAPKFPTPHNLVFLLRRWTRTEEEEALWMVEETLAAMRRGGIYDHVGFGFHRYSTDRQWLLPHFEKMLYDQALLVLAYSEAYTATKRPLYRQTVEETLTYVLRDMTDEAGAFLSAEDADSEGVEGKFYVWRKEEIEEILDRETARLFCNVYNIRKGGNFRPEAGEEQTGANIPHMTGTWEEAARELETDEDALRERMQEAREALFEVREKRVHPHKDDKVLTDWNGLMIAAMATAGRRLDKPAYRQAAAKAANFIMDRLRKDNGRLLHRYREGEAGVTGHLDDYAFMVWGLIELYEASLDPMWLRQAIALQAIQDEHFWDEADGGYFLTADDSEELLVRQKDVYDGATPSGNSVALLNLLRLSRLTGDPDQDRRPRQLTRTFAGTVERAPLAFTQFLIAVDFLVGGSWEVVIAGAPEAAETRRMLEALRNCYVPQKLVVLRGTGREGEEVAELIPFTREMAPQDDQPKAFVCTGGTCRLPTTDVETMLAQLRGEGHQ